MLVGFYRGDDAKKVVLMEVNLYYKSHRGRYYTAKSKALDKRLYDGEWGKKRLLLGL